LFYIGIDFSVNFGSICISKDFKEFRWISVINGNLTQKFRRVIDSFNDPTLEVIDIFSKESKTDHYHLTERNKLNNQLDVVSKLVARLKEYVKDDPCIIGIEGYSYGSAGNSLIDIAQATGILKNHLFREIVRGNLETMFVFSPSELKKAIGEKGNCGKVEIFNKFISDPIIPEVRNSSLYKFISENKDDIFNGKEVKSPIMDMVDSFLPIVKFKSIMT